MDHLQVVQFSDKLNGAIARNRSLLFVGLDPNPEMLSDRTGDPLSGLRERLLQLVADCADLVCAFKPTLGFYQSLGAPGITLLCEVLEAIPAWMPVILDAKHGDLNTGTLFARTIFEEWRVDAVTLNPYAGQDLVAPFLVYPDRGVFVLCCTSNPTAARLQTYPSPESAFYLHLAREARSWGTAEQLGLEVGTTDLEVLARVRAVAPERILLVRSIWAEGAAKLEPLLAAGLDSDGGGLLVPVPQECLQGDDPGQEVDRLRRRVEEIRGSGQQTATCAVWSPDICLLRPDPRLDLVLQLFDAGCFLFGDYVQASGSTFPYYVDLRKVISNPQLFHRVVGAYAEIVGGLEFDRIAGIPYGSLPTASGLALRLNRPMIFPRKEVKAHGTRRVIEGAFAPGERAIVIDDILISGGSVCEGVGKLQSAGLAVRDVVVFIDHGLGAEERLAAEGLRCHTVLQFAEIQEMLFRANRIDEQQYRALNIHT